MRQVNVDNILAEIKECKVMQDSSNSDYRTGYISALSTVEGIIADQLLTEEYGECIPIEWIKKTTGAS